MGIANVTKKLEEKIKKEKKDKEEKNVPEVLKQTTKLEIPTEKKIQEVTKQIVQLKVPIIEPEKLLTRDELKDKIGNIGIDFEKAIRSIEEKNAFSIIEKLHNTNDKKALPTISDITSNTRTKKETLIQIDIAQQTFEEQYGYRSLILDIVWYDLLTYPIGEDRKGRLEDVQILIHKMEEESSRFKETIANFTRVR